MYKPINIKSNQNVGLPLLVGSCRSSPEEPLLLLPAALRLLPSIRRRRIQLRLGGGAAVRARSRSRRRAEIEKGLKDRRRPAAPRPAAVAHHPLDRVELGQMKIESKSKLLKRLFVASLSLLALASAPTALTADVETCAPEDQASGACTAELAPDERPPSSSSSSSSSSSGERDGADLGYY